MRQLRGSVGRDERPGLEDEASHQGDDADGDADRRSRLEPGFGTLRDNRSGPGESDRSANAEGGVGYPGQRAGSSFGRLSDARRGDRSEAGRPGRCRIRAIERGDHAPVEREDREERGDRDGEDQAARSTVTKPILRRESSDEGCHDELDRGGGAANSSAVVWPLAPKPMWSSSAMDGMMELSTTMNEAKNRDRQAMTGARYAERI